ncbi:hypothetical protein PX699_17690 [Sphingobium sp. H39-3-25]|uniref:hypothetical protein n=1 Tax=Sphingobium arseniciresistens TaxID=3030834 RepID=UPI0023BA04E5|nr:hypothetical protein [Sphingobium arseniciresistens]
MTDTIGSHFGNGGQFDPDGAAALIDRYKRWLQNIRYYGDLNSPPMLMLDLVERQAAEIGLWRGSV